MELPIILRNIAYLGADLVKADAAGMALINGNGDLVLSSYSHPPIAEIP